MDYKQASDIELWVHCQHDDDKAYNELFVRYYPRLLSVANKYVADRLDAEEMCMDFMFDLWTKRSQINVNQNFSGYLSRSIYNRVVTYLRKQFVTTTGLEEVPDHRQQDCPADENLIAKEAEQAYTDALDKLSPQRRKVFQLNREQNLSYAEIAQEMNLSVNTVENYMVASLRSLRKDMKDFIPIALLPVFSFASNFALLLLF